MSLKNDDFRKLLATMPKSRPGEATPARGTAHPRRDAKTGGPAKAPGPAKKKYYHHKKKDDKDDDEKDEVDKIYDESTARLNEIMKSYRDRAAERRKADTNKDEEEAALRLMIHGIMPTNLNSKEVTIEQSKLLGGDIEHTHMVKGLDYTLLEKMRNEKEEESEDEDDQQDVAASSLPPEKVATNPMVRRVLRTLFHTAYPKRNEHFGAGRMAYVCNFENADNDVPTTLIRALDETPKENPSVKTDKLILEHLTNILPYLRDKKRNKKKKKVLEDSEVKADGDTDGAIFEGLGEYNTRVKPLKEAIRDKTNERERERGREASKSGGYFDDRRDRDRDRRDRRDRDRSPDRRDRDRRHRRSSRSRSRSPDRRHRRTRSRSPERRKRQRSPSDSPPRKSSTSTLKAAAGTASSSSKDDATARKRLKQSEAYSEYYTEDMDFVETIGSDDDDNDLSALAMARDRMRQELDTDGTAKKPSKSAKLDKKKPQKESKADVERKLDNELKKMEEIWSSKSKPKLDY
uniref:RED_N domain-containing protein n=1 Tax=Panagrellus redivivus TaxID=6233 RepID=A0A7E4VWW9_PANRE